MATPRNAPAKKTAKAPAKRPGTKAVPLPGDPKFDWRSVYPPEVQLFSYTSQDGFIVKLPAYDDPGEGEVFGLMLLNKTESDLLVYVMRQHITKNARDPENGLLTTFRALQRMKAPGVIESLLKAWPEASGKELGKS